MILHRMALLAAYCIESFPTEAGELHFESKYRKIERLVKAEFEQADGSRAPTIIRPIRVGRRTTRQHPNTIQ